MKRLGIGLAMAALMLGAGCGSGSGEANKANSATPTLKLLSAGQACAQVQQVNDELHGPGGWPIPTYGKFGDETATLAEQSVPEIAPALKSMSDQAVKVGSMHFDDAGFAAAGEWAKQYQAVADICARTDSPIGRLP